MTCGKAHPLPSPLAPLFTSYPLTRLDMVSVSLLRRETLAKKRKKQLPHWSKSDVVTVTVSISDLVKKWAIEETANATAIARLKDLAEFAKKKDGMLPEGCMLLLAVTQRPFTLACSHCFIYCHSRDLA